jgi:hypothetical protein
MSKEQKVESRDFLNIYIHAHSIDSVLITAFICCQFIVYGLTVFKII